MNKFYYKIELSKGYIPNDKCVIRDIAFEQGRWAEIIGRDLDEKWNKVRHEIPMDKKKFKDILSQININISEWEKKYPPIDPKEKRIYLNFNADGIDCFMSRWNYKS
jgi:hypothetical protein